MNNPMNIPMNLSSSRHPGSLMLVIFLHLLVLWGLWLSTHAARPAPPKPEPKLMWMVAVAPAPAPTPVPQMRVSVPKVVKFAQPMPTKALVQARLPALPVRVTSFIPAVSEPTAQPVPDAVASASAPPAPAAPPVQPAPLTQPQFNAAYLNNPLPSYPPILRRAGEQGRVVLRVLVNMDGTAGEVRVEKSSGSALFDEAALAAVRKWRFVPARRGDVVVAEWVQVPIDFKLS